jgi:hypothetical protein
LVDIKYPQCLYAENDDCFARNRKADGTIMCKALTDTVFANGCPFYKPRWKFEKEIAEERKRRYGK